MINELSNEKKERLINKLLLVNQQHSGELFSKDMNDELTKNLR